MLSLGCRLGCTWLAVAWGGVVFVHAHVILVKDALQGKVSCRRSAGEPVKSHQIPLFYAFAMGYNQGKCIRHGTCARLRGPLIPTWRDHVFTVNLLLCQFRLVPDQLPCCRGIGSGEIERRASRRGIGW